MTSGLAAWMSARGFASNDVSVVDADGLTPLLKAAVEGDAETLRQLVAAGACLGAVTRDGNDALWLACKHHSPAAAEVLVGAGIDLHRRNLDGSTALTYAASAGRTAVVALLLQHGANPLLENLDGYSALDLAANLECLKLLRAASRPRSAQTLDKGLVET